MRAMRKLVLALFVALLLTKSSAQIITREQLIEIERDRVIRLADSFLNEKPITITEFKAERSAGGLHDYYSEGTYWWPNPNDPEGPYIRKDGIQNPDNFEKHAIAVRKFSIISASLTSAYVVTGKRKYTKQVENHLNAWFVNSKTKMNPNLLYAQAIKGVVTGRGIGIIDMIHFIEVARSVMVLEKEHVINNKNLKKIKLWFREFLTWMTNHKYGLDERNNGNNHSTWWAAQVAMYSLLVGDSQNLENCNEFFIDQILGKQMAVDGSFPEELKRTKPYSYSLFNLEGTMILAKILSLGGLDVWTFKSESGKSVKTAMEFIFPFIEDKAKWSFPKDVENYDSLPVRMESLLFYSIAYNDKRCLYVWKKLSTSYKEEELIRTFPIRQPVLWINK